MSNAATTSGRAELVIFGAKGLIDISVAEVTAAVKDISVVATDDKFAVVSVPLSEFGQVLKLRTVDDVRWLLAGPQQVQNESEFSDFLKTARDTADVILQRDSRGEDTWSVTMAVRRPVWRDRPQWSPREALGAIWNGADPDVKQRSAIDIRLQVDGSTMLACLNLAEAAAWNRNKEAPQWHGALKASIAASLVGVFDSQVTEEVRAQGIYDPFCGSGTILAEAASLGISVDGSDIESEAVELARKRIAAAQKGTSVREPALFTHDVHRGFPASRVRAASIVTNMPWGKQVKIPRKTELFDAIGGLVAEAHSRGGIAVILTGDPDQLSARIRKTVRDAKLTARQIGMLGQTPTVLIVTKE
ncbi:MAG: TRM11 family SAM-dependent methyltransferase [Pseudonocardiaceae bacterium]